MKPGFCSPLLFVFYLTVQSTPSASATQFKAVSENIDEFEARFSGRIYLNKKFIDPDKETKDQILAAIKLQIMYGRGSFETTSMNQFRSAVIYGQEPTIEVSSISQTTYPFALVIDERPHEMYTIKDAYMTRAIADGNTRRSDPAILAQYTVRTKISTLHLSKENRRTNRIFMHLPLDPYLHYWQVPPKKRRLLQFDEFVRTENPCAIPDLIEYPDPQYFWHFAKNNASSVDKTGKPFRCSELLEEGVHFDTTEVRLSASQRVITKSRPPVDHWHSNDKFSASVIFGFNNYNDQVGPDWKVILPELTLNKWLRGSVAHETLGQDNVNFHAFLNQDLKSLGFKHFLNGLEETIAVKRFRLHHQSNNLQLLIEGQFLKSSKPVVLHVFFGPTDLLGWIKSDHWTFLQAALPRDDVILYAGHSGLGENMNTKNLQQANELSDRALQHLVNRKPYQVFGFFSCLSYGYFAQDIISLKWPSKAYDIIMNATNARVVADDFGRLTLGTLAFIDSALVDKNATWEHLRDFNIREEDGLVVIGSKI